MSSPSNPASTSNAPSQSSLATLVQPSEPADKPHFGAAAQDEEEANHLSHGNTFVATQTICLPIEPNTEEQGSNVAGGIRRQLVANRHSTSRLSGTSASTRRSSCIRRACQTSQCGSTTRRRAGSLSSSLPEPGWSCSSSSACVSGGRPSDSILIFC